MTAGVIVVVLAAAGLSLGSVASAAAPSYNAQHATAALRAPLPTHVPVPNASAAPAVDGPQWYDAETESARLEAWRHYYLERQKLADSTAYAFSTQSIHTWAIFVFVLFATTIGLAAAVAQFIVGLRHPESTAPATKLVLGPTSLELDSTSLAVIIFAMTGALFFIFVRFVYPVTYVGNAAVPDAAPTISAQNTLTTTK
jgi:hypothetical protein